MNYLAHLFLSRDYPEAIMGNFLTDMMNISEIKSNPALFHSGELLHRHIDSFTDHHQANQTMKHILHPYFHKYAGVALDIYYDYILYQNWKLYSDLGFESFCWGQYDIIQTHFTSVPGRLRPVVKRMINGDFLHRYTTIEGQSFAFSRMEHRARFHTGFEKAIAVLEKHMDDLMKQFNLFFPDMIEEVGDFMDNRAAINRGCT